MFCGLVEKKTAYSLDGIDTIWVQTDSSDIHFVQANNPELGVWEIMLANDPGVQAERKGTALCLCEKRAGINSGFHVGNMTGREQKKLKLQIPESFHGQIYAETASKDIELRGNWWLQNLQMKTASGDIEVGCVQAEHLLLESISGDVDIEQALGDLQVYSTSGDIYVQNAGSRVHASTCSGDMNIAGMNAKAILESKSGDIEAEFTKITEGVTVKNVSGDVEIKIAAGSDYFLAAKSVSGDVDVAIRDAGRSYDDEHTCQVRVGGANEESGPLVQITTVSGDIDVYD